MFQTVRHCLFDFDGTLVDSASLHAEAFRATLTRARPEALAGFRYDALKGLATEEAFARLGFVDPAQQREMAAEKRRHYRDAVERGALSLIPGAEHALWAARHSGRSVFLVTSGSEGSVSMALRALGIAASFDGVVTYDGSFPAKPAPDLFLACLDRYDLSAADCLVVEDAASGIVAAHAAGIRAAGVNNPGIADLADAYFTLESLAGMLEASPVALS